MLFAIRRRFGLYWPASLPPFPWAGAFATVALLLVYGLADKIEQLGDKAAAMETAADYCSAYKRTLFDCMAAGKNGDHSGFYFPDTKKAYECRVNPL